MHRPFRVLELYCGIGGCAAALGPSASVVAAIDIHRTALTVYQRNFSHPVLPRTIESLDETSLVRWGADLWWMSPPCQPFTCRGRRRDAEDPRARSLLQLIDRLNDLRPSYLALENVPGFRGSRAHAELRSVFERRGYDVQEHLLCPTDFGVPNRRRRFYLVAGRRPLGKPPQPSVHQQPLRSFLDPEPSAGLRVEPALVQRYCDALNVIDADDPDAVTSCFTSAYGRSPVRSGSYLRTDSGIRRFSPSEILRLLGFPPGYSLPPALSRQAAWRLVGNSLSIPVVRHVLSAITELAESIGHAAGQVPGREESGNAALASDGSGQR
jgi:site-specific DNA-cytosine methylase